MTNRDKKRIVYINLQIAGEYYIVCRIVLYKSA